MTNNLIKNIHEKNFVEAENAFKESMNKIVSEKLFEMRKIIASQLAEQSASGKGDLPQISASGKRSLPGSEEDANEIIDQNTKALKLQQIRGIRKPGPTTLPLEEEEQLDEAPRVKIVRARIRGGKIQRRKKVSNVKGYTFRSGKLTRMSPSERRKRKLGQRRGKMKRKAKLSRTLMKRKRSMMKRRSIGLR